MQITTTVEITPRKIADLMVTAIEGGITYWCAGIYLNVPAEKETSDTSPTKGCWYDNDAIYKNPDLRIQVTELEASKGNKKNHVIGLKEIERGFQIMSGLKNGEGGHHWRDLLDETGDATTADVWLQCCVFGEIVYG